MGSSCPCNLDHNRNAWCGGVFFAWVSSPISGIHCRLILSDHHCPWVNNCIGHFNYGHFIRFLFYVDLACSYHLAMVTRRVFDTMGKRYWVKSISHVSIEMCKLIPSFKDEPSGVELVFIILNYVACVPVILSVGAFRSFLHPLVFSTCPYVHPVYIISTACREIQPPSKAGRRIKLPQWFAEGKFVKSAFMNYFSTTY